MFHVAPMKIKTTRSANLNAAIMPIRIEQSPPNTNGKWPLMFTTVIVSANESENALSN